MSADACHCEKGCKPHLRRSTMKQSSRNTLPVRTLKNPISKALSAVIIFAGLPRRALTPSLTRPHRNHGNIKHQPHDNAYTSFQIRMDKPRYALSCPMS